MPDEIEMLSNENTPWPNQRMNFLEKRTVRYLVCLALMAFILPILAIIFIF